MNILFVTNNINVPGNGICTSVNTTVQHLRDKGIDARFLSGISKDPKALLSNPIMIAVCPAQPVGGLWCISPKVIMILTGGIQYSI